MSELNDTLTGKKKVHVVEQFQDGAEEAFWKQVFLGWVGEGHDPKASAERADLCLRELRKRKNNNGHPYR